MTLNATGDKNRLARRDFNENRIHIDRFDGRRTINIAIPSEIKDERPLVKAQRKELNSCVAEASKASGSEAYEIWQKVHAEIGVSSIEEMTVNQYQTAISFLHAMIERGKEKDASKALVGLLLRNSQDSGVRQKLIRYCHVNFGTGRLTDLTRSQLQLALSWLDQQSHKIDESPHDSILNANGLVFLFRVHAVKFIVVFFLGFVLGALLI